MDMKHIEQATFPAVYRFLQGKEDTAIKKCFCNLFKVSLLLFPAILGPEAILVTELSSGASLAGIGVGKLVSDAAHDAFSCFHNKSASDYYSRFDQMQIAQVMLIYASYFEAISQVLPNENGEIQLTPNLKRKLSCDALDQYCKGLEKSAQKPRPDLDLLEEEIPLPDPNGDFKSYEQQLRRFFGSLNEQFVRFFERCPFWESLDGENDPLDQAQKQFFRTLLSKLPEEAVSFYRKQYFALSKTFPDFAIWANQEDHRRLEKQIDVGFSQLMKFIYQHYAFTEHTNCDVADTLSRYQTKYEHYIQKPIIEHSGHDTVFPARKEIFIPQAFQTLTYHYGMALEQKGLWEHVPHKEEIGAYIRSVLSHPSYGRHPVLILGHPGAGKTLLCHMLAAQILSAEYHVIIIRLRDAVADEPIWHQIDAQIALDFGDGTCWNDIRRAGLNKPVLLIFDGYDELLQASGKTYANYLLDIAKFQEEQCSYFQMFVRCIITSRITLIDKASVPEGSQVLHLCDFDPIRIQAWTDIWNRYNETLFAEQGLEKLKIASTGRIRELASQPLLLLMLALYVMNGNSLGAQTGFSRAELYYKLIHDFIVRENEKDTRFLQLNEFKRAETITRNFRRLGTVALGMHNRRTLAIRSTELKQDLAFLSLSSAQQKSTDDYALEEDEKLVGSFFFIHNAESTVRNGRTEVRLSAYEFLHNTFGEFLTAYYILDATLYLVRRQRRAEEFNEPFTWAPMQEREWHTGLVYTPLFTRPIVLNMIYELLPLMVEEKGLTVENVQLALDTLFSSEIRRLITGELYATVEKTISAQGNPFEHPELAVHIATYSVNLILLRAAVGSFDFTECLGTGIDWHKLAQLWRYAFSEEDLLSLSCLIHPQAKDGCYYLTYRYDEKIARQTEYMSKLDRMYRVADVLGENAAMAVFGVCNKIIDSNILSILEKEKLPLQVQYELTSIFQSIGNLGFQEPQIFLSQLDALLRSSDAEYSLLGIYVYCFLIDAFAKQNLLNNEFIFQLLNRNFIDVLTHLGKRFDPPDRRLYLCMAFQCILESLECVPFYLDNYAELLCCIIKEQEYLNSQQPETRGKQNAVMRRQFEQVFSLYCQNVLNALRRGKGKEIMRACYALEIICASCARQVSWRGIPQLLEVCEKLQQKGGRDTEQMILSAYFQVMGPFPDIDYLQRLPKKSTYLHCFIKYYNYLWRTKKSYSPDSLFVKGLGEIDMLDIFLPCHEETIFHLLCLLCAFPNAASSLRFDLSTDLEQILHRYGPKLSVQTLQKILECAQQFGYTVVYDTARQLFC